MRTTSKLSDKQDHLGSAIGYVSREINRVLDARVAAEVTPELSGVRGVILSRIVCANTEDKIVCQRDVEEWCHIRRSSVTTLLQGLEQDGFITRVPVAGDARLKRLIPTEKGSAYQKQIAACIKKFEKKLRQDISPEELALLDTTLHRMLDNLHAMATE